MHSRVACSIQGAFGRVKAPIRTEITVHLDQAAWRDAVAGIHSLIEAVVNVLVTTECPNGVSRTESRLEAMQQGLVDTVVDENFRSIKVESIFICIIEDVIY